jgi:tryptophan-rich sensory protein
MGDLARCWHNDGHLSTGIGRMLALIAFFLLTAAAASAGAMFQPGDWYAALEKPALTPPDWVFPVVWSVIYAMIAISGWLLWRARDGSRDAMLATAFWAAQLVLNAAWSWIFFELHLTGMALAEIGLLWLAILLVVVFGMRVRPIAAALFVPYLLWVSFAAWLNFGIWRLNA